MNHQHRLSFREDFPELPQTDELKNRWDCGEQLKLSLLTNYGLLVFWKGYKGITTFIVPKETEGLSLGKKEDKVCLFLCIIT